MATPGAFDQFEKFLQDQGMGSQGAQAAQPAIAASPVSPARPPPPAYTEDEPVIAAAQSSLASLEVISKADVPELEVVSKNNEKKPEAEKSDSRESSPSINIKYSFQASASSLVGQDGAPPLQKRNSEEIIAGIEMGPAMAMDNDQIEVVDGLALLDQPSAEYSDEEGRPSNVAPHAHKSLSNDSDDEPAGFLLEMDVEEGKELPPSPKRKMIQKRAATMNKLDVMSSGPAPSYVNASWFTDESLKISHIELMVGGPIPKTLDEKDDLIQRLRMFINRLNSQLEQTEERSKLLKRKYSKKAEEVKESEELVRTLTGRLTEQATAVAQQMKEVQEARKSERNNSAMAVAAAAAAAAERVNDGGIGSPDSMRNVLAAVEEGEKAEAANAAPKSGGLERSQSHKELLQRQQLLIDNLLPADSFPGFTYKLTIKAPPMGFTLKKDEGARYAKVATISRNDLKKAGLVQGLQILSVNGSSLANMSLVEIKGVLSNSEMPAEIRMRRALSPWTRYQEYSTTKWKTKKAINTWTFYCSRSKPRIIVLEHNQRTLQGKSKRKITIDGEIRYQRKSQDESFKFHLDNDVVYLKIGKNSQGGFKYTLRINELTFEEARTNFLIMRSEVV